MGEYCTHASIRRHPANPGEVLKVQRLFGHDEAGLFGEHDEIACIPHNGRWIEIVGTAEAAHPEVNLLLPGEVLRCTRSFFFKDRLELPSGRKVRLRALVGSRLQLLTRTGPTPPTEEAIVTRPRERQNTSEEIPPPTRLREGCPERRDRDVEDSILLAL